MFILNNKGDPMKNAGQIEKYLEVLAGKLADQGDGRVFADVLFVYLPTDEYMLALKIAAYRRKDRVDCLVLLHRLGITTREETQDILDTFLSEQEQRIWDVDQKLKRLFR